MPNDRLNTVNGTLVCKLINLVEIFYWVEYLVHIPNIIKFCEVPLTALARGQARVAAPHYQSQTRTTATVSTSTARVGSQEVPEYLLQ